MKKFTTLFFAAGLFIVACKSTKETSKTETLNCGTTQYTLTADIQPIITSNCAGCHGIKGKKAGLDFTQAETIKQVAADGRLVCVMRAGKNCKTMPPDQPLSKDVVDKVECWVNNGMK